MPNSTNTMDMILALFARHELCTDPNFHQMLKDIEETHYRTPEKETKKGKAQRYVESPKNKQEVEKTAKNIPPKQQ